MLRTVRSASRLNRLVIAATSALIAIAPVLTLSALGPAVRAEAPPIRNYADLGITPRQQWNANYGYCGETSLISAGMQYGQYTSQWTARSLASPGISQTKPASQLLLGVNEVAAARSMKLDVESFDGPSNRSSARFLMWIKSQVVRGNPVIIGVFDNMRFFGERLPGDAEYDHIVPILGVGSRTSLVASDRTHHPDDLIVFSDNGLSGAGTPASSIHQSRLGAFARTRTQANSVDAPIYSLPKGPINYGIAVTGVRDPDRVTIPVRLTSTAWGEGARDRNRLTAPPPPIFIQLTATVLMPRSDIEYTVYLYDDFAKVPIRNFNAAAANAIESWIIPPGSGPTWSKTVSVMSDQTRVIRAVPSSGP